MGSDHDVYQDSSFGIPAIYLNDWPDRYIHTNFDTAANIDTTKLKRAAFIGAASGYFLAGLVASNVQIAQGITEHGKNVRRAQLRSGGIADLRDKLCRYYFQDRYENEVLFSSARFVGIAITSQATYPNGPNCPPEKSNEKASDALSRFRRNTEPRGPLAVFGYDYFADHANAAGVATPKLMSYEGLWGSREEYAYEILNFADGKRNAQEIRDAVSAEYGPVPLEMVVEYLRALEKIGVVAEVK
jgi:aminopeptidase YwaD